MALQDRLNRGLLENWSTREQLCLASAVSCSGDQNWVSVSRNLKIVCCNNNESNSRPADWFSQKSCALQYANLLENVETPKRKKRTSEGNSRGSSPATIVETPTDSVLRRLTEERIQELKTEIRKDQEEFAKLHAEQQKIQSAGFSEEMLRKMWREIEQEQEAQRIAEMKLENQMREREQRKQEMQRSWRQQENNAVVDMDVEEIIGVSKPIIPSQQQQTATSPLLSSLLKSPTTTLPPQINSASTARTTAPTITTLLTSGSIPNSDQPAITLNTNLIPPDKAVKLLSRPISGPPIADSQNLGNQHLLSPSQSAPTLSMLLERNKTLSTAIQQPQNNESNTTSLFTKSNSSITIDSNKEEVPMDIDEESTNRQNENETAVTVDSDEPDPNEEQQLMEVFKNIGNIDELDIDVAAVIDDEEVDFLKGVGEDSPSTATEAVDFDKLNEDLSVEAISAKSEISNEKKMGNIVIEEEKSPEKSQHGIDTEAIEIKIETSSDDSNDNIPLAAVATLENERNQSTPSVDVDDKSKEKNFLKEKVESAITNAEEVDQETKDKDLSNIKEKIKTEAPDDTESNIKVEEQLETDMENKTIKNNEGDECIAPKACEDTMEDETEQGNQTSDEAADGQSERFATPTGEDVFEIKIEASKNQTTINDDNKSDSQNLNSDRVTDNTITDASIVLEDESDNAISQEQENVVNQESNASTQQPVAPSHVSIADTDEDSCTTDISTTTSKRDEKPSTSTANLSRNKQTPDRTSQQRKTALQDSSSKSIDDSDSSSGSRALKRSLFSILSNLSSTKSAQAIQRALGDEQLKFKYQKVCRRRLDFITIKKNIENGTIRNAVDLQRDLLQISQNILFLFHKSTATYKAGEVFKHEMQNVREFIFNSHEFETKTEKETKEIKQNAGKQLRTGSRKSQRIA